MAIIKEVLITDIEEFDSVDVVEVLVKEGDEVELDQPIVTIESEKAMMDFPSPYKGVVQKLSVSEGGQVKEGDTILTLEVQEDSDVDVPQTAKSTPEDLIPDREDSNTKASATSDTTADLKTQEKITPITPTGTGNGYASPGVQKFARKLGVDINQITGSGRGQRVTKEDVQQFVRTNVGSTSAATGTVSQIVKPLDFSAYGEVEAKDLTKIQKVTAKNMLNAWQGIPHVTHFDQADVTALEIHRKKLASELKEKNIKLTPLTFVIKALILTLKQFPIFNTSLDVASDKLIYKKFFHIGIAVDTPHGLLVPVIRDVDKKTITQVAAELINLSELARQRKLSPKQMSGASMSISSLGILGGQAFTPIINPPEVAILGISKMIVNEKLTENGSEQQKLLPLALSYDHRVINGADAARFCTYLIDVLEDIWKLIL